MKLKLQNPAVNAVMFVFVLVVCLPLGVIGALVGFKEAFFGLWKAFITDLKMDLGVKPKETQPELGVWERHIEMLDSKKQ